VNYCYLNPESGIRNPQSIIRKSFFMSPFISEILGTALLITLGNGVVANVLLSKSKGQNSGWIVITFGWAMAVFVGVYTSAAASGAHLNPAVTLALAFKGDLSWDMVPIYIGAQMLGAMIGALIVWLTYRSHFEVHENATDKLGIFCTIPAIRNPLQNLLTEILATMVFVIAILSISKPESKLGALDALPVALLVFAIGLSLGGPTGYAINPARDLGPRIMHAILPIRGKGGSDWTYAWVPILGPIIGALIAVLIFQFVS
jgi:glycerol uptake facilitator protein